MMTLFHSRIDPYSSLTINLGPLYVERVFDSLLTKQGVTDVLILGDIERLEHYLNYLKKRVDNSNRQHYPIIQFYKAHFYQQLAAYFFGEENRQHCLEKALCYYQTYLELAERHDESRYYAQWQTGMLHDILKYPWPLAEDALLKASAIDILRGEATKKIVDHYIYNKEWKNAYRYSTIALETFLGKNPIAYRRWFVDFDAYNGTILNTHRMIGYKLGYLKEKNTVSGKTTY